MLYFSKKNKEIKNLKNGGKKWPRTPIYKYYSGLLQLFENHGPMSLLSLHIIF